MLCTALLAASSGASALVAVPRAAPLPCLRVPQATMAERWQDEPILDASKADPVFTADTPYKGRVGYGFSNAAEKFNGRAAMMGFSIAYVQELVTGKGVLSLYGLPYDQGAVVVNGGGNIIAGVGGLVGALVVVTALSYAGEIAFSKVDPDYDGKKLPKLPFM